MIPMMPVQGSLQSRALIAIGFWQLTVRTDFAARCSVKGGHVSGIVQSTGSQGATGKPCGAAPDAGASLYSVCWRVRVPSSSGAF